MSPKRALLYLTLMALLVAGAGCRDDSGSEEAARSARANADQGGTESNPVDIDSDEEKLLLIDLVPLGIGYEDVKSRIPETGEMNIEAYSEYMQRQGLARASTELRVLDRDAKLDFNFENNNLYSYYYRIEGLDEAAASELYSRLQAFYSGRFGKPREELQAEGGARARSSYWSADKYHVAMTDSLHPGGHTLSWGFQSEQP
ncbi:MAG TPA: hypothetical protein VE262_25505 [Blastocatellia bacterium]|nr:hypothetical protein [Blastocatellia bacterium]